MTLACLVLAVVWLGVLPRIARRDDFRQRLERHRARGIDPSALFYTELPAAMDETVREPMAPSGSQ